MRILQQYSAKWRPRINRNCPCSQQAQQNKVIYRKIRFFCVNIDVKQTLVVFNACQFGFIQNIL